MTRGVSANSRPLTGPTTSGGNANEQGARSMAEGARLVDADDHQATVEDPMRRCADPTAPAQASLPGVMSSCVMSSVMSGWVGSRM